MSLEYSKLNNQKLEKIIFLLLLLRKTRLVIAFHGPPHLQQPFTMYDFLGCPKPSHICPGNDLDFPVWHFGWPVCPLYVCLTGSARVGPPSVWAGSRGGIPQRLRGRGGLHHEDGRPRVSLQTPGSTGRGWNYAGERSPQRGGPQCDEGGGRPVEVEVGEKRWKGGGATE